MTEASETFDGFARVREMLEAVERRMDAIERMAPLRPAPRPEADRDSVDDTHAP